MTTRRGFLSACLAAGGLVLVPKLPDRYKWSRTGKLIVRSNHTDWYGYAEVGNKIHHAWGKNEYEYKRLLSAYPNFNWEMHNVPATWTKPLVWSAT